MWLLNGISCSSPATIEGHYKHWTQGPGDPEDQGTKT